jgi:hypothetical protein
MLKCAAMATSNRDPRWLGWLAPALISVFLVQAWLESRIKSVTSDEPPHIAAGLSYVEKGVFRANLQHPPLMKELAAVSLLIGGVRLPENEETRRMLYGAIPPGLPPEWTIGNQIIAGNGADRVMAWARAPMLLVAGLLAAVLFLWGRELVGGWAALGAVFLYTMDPTILGHSYLVTTDVGVTAFMLLFLMALWRYVQSATRGRLVWCGVALGAMLCAKFSAVLIVPVAGFLLLASRMRRADKALGTRPVPGAGRNEPCPCGSGKKYKACHGAAGAARPAGPPPAGFLTVAVSCAGPFLAMCAMALIVIGLVYFSASGPALYLRGLRQVNADHNPDYQLYLAGTLDHRFISYFAVAWLLKEPVASIVLTAMGLAFLIRSRTIPVIAKLFLLAPPVVVFLGATFLADDIGVRYIMPVLPFGHLLGGLGIAALAQWGRSRLAIRHGVARIAAAALLCLWVAIAAFGIDPDHLPYFNEAACFERPGEIGFDGGTRCGPQWLDDSNVDWGQSMKQLKRWLDAHAAGRPLKLASYFNFPPEAYGIHYVKAEISDLAMDPQPGLYAVSATMVARIPAYPGASDWLRRLRPVAFAGHSIYIYDIPPN